MIEEVFKQLASGSPLPYLSGFESYCLYETRRKRNGSTRTLYSRTVTKAKSLENTLRNANTV